MSPGETVRAHVVIHGRVQGVWFRDSCRREAENRGVTGWVRNNPDGTVEAVFEGAPDAVDAVVDFCRQGPPRATVADVEVEREESRGEPRFRVR